MKFKVIDITTGISENTPVYEGDPLPVFEKVSSIEKDGFKVTRISIGTHTGTHVDAPLHLYECGQSVADIDPGSLMGKAVLLDISSGNGPITDNELETIYKSYSGENADIILIKTRSCSSECLDECLHSDRMLAATAGKWIYENGFRVVGVDTLSVDENVSLPNHHLFLSNNINIIEYLDLMNVNEGTYFFICLPLKLEGCDGAPARAILMDIQSIDEMVQ
ncbi:Kynurenine formamidase [Methanolobus vulcani]|jgi:arylformamidase|uniref:Kynurenine formamidase n=1 Tax=Methanolobus vulcani TaxID=38026 RepID=A0A7Z7AV21_9EURY|nr:cyclase family protein [Methanolobus vulcani]SDF34569.1 Kynurenine formamidase [Methanolobus vulcani]